MYYRLSLGCTVMLYWFAMQESDHNQHETDAGARMDTGSSQSEEAILIDGGDQGQDDGSAGSAVNPRGSKCVPSSGNLIGLSVVVIHYIVSLGHQVVSDLSVMLTLTSEWSQSTCSLHACS